MSDRLPGVSDPSPMGGNLHRGFPVIADYAILDVLGEGGMGVVYRATHVPAGRLVALKILRGAQWTTEDARRRFDREIRNAAKLVHPNIARLYDAGYQGEICYYTMELVHGTPVNDYVSAHNRGPLAIVRLMCTVCEAVAYAHGCGIVHRDLKPEHICVTPDAQPHLLDFGVSLAMDDPSARLTVVGSCDTPGTIEYMSPEQAAGRPDIDKQTDIYSLGVVLFLLLTRKWPRDMSGTREQIRQRIARDPAAWDEGVRRSLGPALDAVLAKAMAHRREDRYGTAEEFGSALGDLVEQIEHRGERESAKDSGGRGAVRSLSFRAGLAIAVASIALAGGLLFHRRHTLTTGGPPEEDRLPVEQADARYSLIFRPAFVDRSNDCRFRPRAEEDELYMDDEDRAALGKDREPSALKHFALRRSDLPENSTPPRRIRAVLERIQGAAARAVEVSEMEELDGWLLDLAAVSMDDKYLLRRFGASVVSGARSPALTPAALSRYEHRLATCVRCLQCDYVFENCGGGLDLQQYVRRKLSRYDTLNPAEQNQLRFKALYLTLKAEGHVPDAARFRSLYARKETE